MTLELSHEDLLVLLSAARDGFGSEWNEWRAARYCERMVKKLDIKGGGTIPARWEFKLPKPDCGKCAIYPCNCPVYSYCDTCNKVEYECKCGTETTNET